MRRFILTGLMAILAIQADAEIIATMPNKAGGMMYLTNNTTDRCKPLRAMFANNSDGKSIWGCWMIDEMIIHIKWDDGGTSAFPVDAFTLVKKNKGQDL